MIRFITIFTFICLSGCKQKDKLVQEQTHQKPGNVPTNHYFLGEEHARKQVLKAIEQKVKWIQLDTLIKDTAAAIAIAEPLLFSLYGKDEILSERPYEVYRIDNYWFIGGTMPRDMEGGVFELILDSRTAEVIRLLHYK